ncbi:MAG: LPS export ABC transporter periplasmic protein LptC [Candidatus Cloacimonadota bacterium]|nr:MAG: LPS export ABC transporter periplasmic protein LptC [Candidatus Cloacimonadota bacterium]
MKKPNKNLLPILSLISLIALFLMSCKSEKIDLPENDFRGLPDEIGEYVSVTAMKGDQKQYLLNTKLFRRYIMKSTVYMDSVYVESYDETGNLSSVLVCDSALAEEVKNIMTAKGNIVIESKNGVLKADYLEWERNSGKIYVKGRVELKRGNHILKGYEMHTDISLDKVTMINVEAEGKPEEGEFK